MKQIIFSLSIICGCLACGTAPKSTELRLLDCYARFLEDESSLMAEATFRRGPTAAEAQPAEMPGGIAYNNTAMSVKSQTGLTYAIKQQNSGVPAHTFSWKNARNESQAFVMPMPAMSDFQFDKSPLSLGQPAQLRWKGPQMGADETLVLLWDNEQHGTVTMQVSGATLQNAIDFPAAELRKLKPGEWSLYLVRKKVSRGTVDGIEARGVAEFYSTTKRFTVK